MRSVLQLSLLWMMTVSKYTIFVNIFTLSNLFLAPDVPEPILGLVCEDGKSAIIIIIA